MKWCSINKYRPPMEILCFVCTEGGYLYTARLCVVNDCSAWSIANECQEEGPCDQILFNVTHFCIPEPVEREYEE